jgi:hypothetical protein
MGLSLSSGVFRFIASSLFGAGSGRSSSRRLQSGSRSARKWGQGTETLAKLGGLPPSGACVWQRLDTGARGGTMRSEGSSRLRRISRRKLVFGRLVEVLTMMQSCASAAKLRAAGPIFWSASQPVRITASRHLGSSIRQCAEKPARAPNSSVVMLVPVTPFRPLDVR